jgi:hypothetical protein
MAQTPSSGRPTAAAATYVFVVVVVTLVVAGLWWVRHDDDPAAGRAADPPATSASSTPAAPESSTSARPPKPTRTAAPTGPATPTDTGLEQSAEDIASQGYPEHPRVLVISVDGLGSQWVTRSTSPTMAGLLADGAGTLNARTEVEKTVTLPNHTSMVTSRRVDAAQGGHGVTWNHDSSQKVVPGTGSMFSAVADAGGSSAAYVGKSKFEMWGRSWPGTITPLEIDEDRSALVADAVDDLRSQHHDLVFVHLAGPDRAGHAEGWGSAAYLDAVEQADADIDSLLSAIEDDPALAASFEVVVTADHGGTPGTTEHGDRHAAVDYTIPFVVWGPGITPGDLYDLNPDYLDPGTAQPGYAGPQPVRNGDVANLVTDLLELPPVDGSELDAAHDLDVR